MYDVFLKFVRILARIGNRVSKKDNLQVRRLAISSDVKVRVKTTQLLINFMEER